MGDLYNLLDVANDSPIDEIKKKYRQLSRIHHPDKNPGDSSAEEFIKKLNRAYEILSNPDSRQQYDIESGNTSYDHIINVSYDDLLYGSNKIWNMPVLLQNQLTKYNIPLSLNIPPKSWPRRILIAHELRILLNPTPDYERRLSHEQCNIIYNHQITVFRALTGINRKIEILGEEHEIIESNPITPETIHIIEDAGLYNMDGSRGNLMIKFDILFPEKISGSQHSYITRCIEIDIEEDDDII